MHFFLGKHAYGKYLCIPNWGIGTEMASLSDCFWNRERLEQDYTGLSDDEVSKYILHKLQLAGASTNIISPAALAAAHSYTQGNPRLICNIASAAHLPHAGDSWFSGHTASVVKFVLFPFVYCRRAGSC